MAIIDHSKSLHVWKEKVIYQNDISKWRRVRTNLSNVIETSEFSPQQEQLSS